MQFSYAFISISIVITVLYSNPVDSKQSIQTQLNSLLHTKNPQEKGLEISKAFEHYNNGFRGEYGKMQLVIMNAQNDKVARIMTQKIIEVPGEGDRSIIEFESPADVRGTKLLTHTMKTAKNNGIDELSQIYKLGYGRASGEYSQKKLAEKVITE